MQDDFDFCQRLVYSADKDRFFCALFAPAEQRAALFALYAFNVEVARVGLRVKEPLAGEIRLQWWREALQGSRSEEARGNPVVAGVNEVIDRYDLPRTRFGDLIEARRYDVSDERMQSIAELENYCRATSSILIELAARVLKPGLSAAETEFANPAGIAIGITELLRIFPAVAARGRMLIPEQVLQRCDADAGEILRGRSGPGLVAALAALREYSRVHLEAARAAIARAPAQVMPAWLPAALVPRYLRALDRRNAEPFRPVQVPQWLRQLALWRAARSGRLGRL